MWGCAARRRRSQSSAIPDCWRSRPTSIRRSSRPRSSRVRRCCSSTATATISSPRRRCSTLRAGSPRSASRSNGTCPTASATASIRTDCATAASFSPAAWRRRADAAIAHERDLEPRDGCWTLKPSRSSSAAGRSAWRRRSSSIGAPSRPSWSRTSSTRRNIPNATTPTRARWSISAVSASPTRCARRACRRTSSVPPPMSRASAATSSAACRAHIPIGRRRKSPTTQMVLERALRRCAERPNGAHIHFGWRLNSFAERDDHVVAEVENVQTGERRLITSRYLLGIDGASSTVRRALGFAMIGEDGSTQRAFMGGTMLSFFIRSPTLMAASKQPPTNMTWIVNSEMRGMTYAQDGRETWVVHYQVPPGADWRTVDAKAVIAAMIGADVDFEIISGGPWTGGLALVAEHYQSGRVFLAGDAGHLFTPLGGLGMNTGIGDVMNLCWKLAAVRQGWAGPRLIESYETERRPMGVRNSQLGVRCTRVMDGWVLPKNFEDDGATADAARRAFGAKIMQEDRPQYLTVGIQLGERYETSPIVWPDEDDAPPDTWDAYTPYRSSR